MRSLSPKSAAHWEQPASALNLRPMQGMSGLRVQTPWSRGVQFGVCVMLCILATSLATAAVAAKKTPPAHADLGSGGSDIKIALKTVSQPLQPEEPQQASYRDNEITVQSKKLADGLALSVSGAHGQKEVALPPEVFEIREIHRYADRIIVVGDVGASVSRVMIINTSSGIASDSFEAYYPAVSPDGRFVAFIKFYPAHGWPADAKTGPEDHDMLYDMAKNPLENRPAGVGLDDMVNVGLNVFPGNGNKDADNIGVPERLAHTTAGLFYWSPDSTKLVFTDRSQSMRLVLVNVSGANEKATPSVRTMLLDRTPVCGAPLSADGACGAYLDNVKFNGGLKAFFSGTGTNGAIHREVSVKYSDFASSH
jgi:hypothetical protein